MTFNKWVKRYKPIKGYHDTIGLFDKVPKGTDPNTVWTYCEFGEGYVICQGWQYVNALGYFITEVPFGDEYDGEIKVKRADMELIN